MLFYRSLSPKRPKLKYSKKSPSLRKVAQMVITFVFLHTGKLDQENHSPWKVVRLVFLTGLNIHINQCFVADRVIIGYDPTSCRSSVPRSRRDEGQRMGI